MGGGKDAHVCMGRWDVKQEQWMCHLHTVYNFTLHLPPQNTHAYMPLLHLAHPSICPSNKKQETANDRYMYESMEARQNNNNNNNKQRQQQEGEGERGGGRGIDRDEEGREDGGRRKEAVWVV